MDKAENYAKSNSITTIPNLSISNATKALYRKYRDAKMITETALQLLSDAIFRDLRLKPLDITFAGRRPHSRNETRVTRETLGVHSGSIWSQSIQIYKYTAARKQLVSAKS